MRLSCCLAGALAAVAAGLSLEHSPVVLAAEFDLPATPDADPQLPDTPPREPSPLVATDSISGLELGVTALPALGGGPLYARDHGDPQLQAVTAVAVATRLAGSVLDAFIGVGVNAAVSAIFGKQPLPVDLAQLIDDALEEVDRIVGDRIAEAFTNEKKTLLNSLGRQVTEYTRRNNLETSREEIGDMLTAASDLLSFFESNGVVTNAAFQTALTLRLALLLELLQLDELIGETDETLDVVRANIHREARNGRAALEEWAATFQPTVNKITEDRDRKSSRRSDIEICMDLRSPRLKRPDRFCKSKVCRSKHTFGHIRKRRIKRCMDNIEPQFRSDVRRHAQKVGIVQFRERNEATIFGEGFRAFLKDLAKVEQMAFDPPDAGHTAAA